MTMNDNENQFIAKVVQRKALQNAVRGIRIKPDKQEKKHIEEPTLTKRAEVEFMCPKFIWIAFSPLPGELEQGAMCKVHNNWNVMCRVHTIWKMAV